MTAGESAAREAERQGALAQAHRQAAEVAARKANSYAIAAVTEKQTAALLSCLESQGFYLLEDRRWPGSRHAQVDLIVIGPSGVFIVDTKAWSHVQIADRRLYRDQADVTDEVSTLVDLAEHTIAVLAEVGLPAGEVRIVLAMAGYDRLDQIIDGDIRVLGQKQLLSAIRQYGQRLSKEQVDLVVNRAESLFEPVAPPAPITPLVPEPVLTMPAQPTLFTVEEISKALLEPVLAKPIEAWMSFLHPQQARLVRRSFPGPSRVRGPAGTGKTVVGLHRAAYLARTRPGKILVATYVSTLPKVLRELMRRLAPEVVERVDFTGIHAFARRILDERGVEYRLQPKAADEAFAEAWRRVGVASTLPATQPMNYWHEEIDYVLKGRGVTTFDQYADLTRTGRRFALSLARRQEVWALYKAYDEELRARGVHDYADLILLAEQALRIAPMTEPYTAVLVDEAQDLSCAMIRLLHSLVGDAPDGLTLIGDGQQSIYPGGYTLAEAGVSVSGRGVVLDINYRNTAQIVAFAQRLVASDEYADIEGTLQRGDTPSAIPRSGPTPDHVWCDSWAQMNRATVARVIEVTRHDGTSYGDVAVLCATHAAANSVAAALRGAYVPVQPLEDYIGTPADAVKVGTIKRAKGLEFKHVLLSHVPHHMTTPAPPVDRDLERWVLGQRELFVAMTRARDDLWVGILS